MFLLKNRTRFSGSLENLIFLLGFFCALILAHGASAQQSFKAPEEAASALVGAAESDNSKAVLSVLGSDGAEIASSGDEVADAATRRRFVAAYDEKHQIAMQGDAKAIMIIGSEDFPFPIPIVRTKDGWQFDAAAGRDEILYRRVGRNELDTI